MEKPNEQLDGGKSLIREVETLREQVTALCQAVRSGSVAIGCEPKA
jgi:hypothetical protein